MQNKILLAPPTKVVCGRTAKWEPVRFPWRQAA